MTETTTTYEITTLILRIEADGEQTEMGSTCHTFTGTQDAFETYMKDAGISFLHDSLPFADAPVYDREGSLVTVYKYTR